MRVLLSDGSGLTARQCATVLSRAGHQVAVLSPDPLCLCRFTRHVRRVVRVPAYGDDPLGWLDAALAAYRRGRFDVLLPTQEQVAVLAAEAGRLDAAGVATAVPPFDALARVQDKLSAFGTLRALRLPQPDAVVLRGRAELAGLRDFPVFVKTPIGTATTGVRRVGSVAELAALPESWRAAADAVGVLAQRPVAGPLLMVQSVFDHGRLVAVHATERLREGARGGASHKGGVRVPVREQLTVLGRELGWHGALSADVIDGPAGPVFIDVNPRLVEPMNAQLSGVDLVGAMLECGLGRSPRVRADGVAGVRTHQLLLAVLGAAQHRGTRRAVAGELLACLAGTGAYRGGTEELTRLRGGPEPARVRGGPEPNRLRGGPEPTGLRGDPRAVLPVALAAAATLVAPGSWAWFAGSGVAGYALTPSGWSRILARRARPEPARPVAAGPAASRPRTGGRPAARGGAE
jgi:hypothetical protein